MSFGIGNVFATTFRIWARNLPRLLVITLLLYIPIFAWVLFSLTDQGRAWLMEHWYAWLSKLSSVLTGNTASGEWIVLAMVGAALAHATVAVMTGERMAIGAAIGVGLRRAPRAIVVALLVRIGTIFVPTYIVMKIWGERMWFLAGELYLYSWVAFYVFLQSLFVVAIPICACEKLGVFASLRRNFALARGHRIKIFGLVLAQNVMLWIAFRIIFELIMDMGGFESYEARMRMWAYIALALELVFSTLLGVLAAVIYERLRASKEGMRPGELDKVFE